MAGLSSPGLGSGLDINSLVTQLVAAEKAPRQAQITRAQTSTVTTISALAQLKGALGSFQRLRLSPLKTLEAFAARGRHLQSDPDIFSASATTSAAPGSYDIEVERLASAHQIVLERVSRAAQGTSVGTGTLTICDGHHHLPGRRSTTRPKHARADPRCHQPVRRQQPQGARHHRQCSRRRAPGADGRRHRRRPTRSPFRRKAATAALRRWSTRRRTRPITLRTARSAQDAIVYIAGFPHTSATNTITDAIDGVTIDCSRKPTTARSTR